MYVYFALHVLPYFSHADPWVASMSNPVDRHLAAKKKERLHLQRESLRLMLASHMDWMQSTIDCETHHIHQEIAELIQKAANHYGVLLDTLQAQESE